MLRVNFENGVKTQEAKVTIDGTDYEVTPAVWSGTTPLSAYNLNRMQDNIEEEVNITLDTEEPAEEVEITNTAPVNGKIDVSGNSTQETRSGKNLVAPSYIINGSLSVGNAGIAQVENNTGYTDTNNTKYRVIRIPNLPAGTYTISINWNYTARIIRYYTNGAMIDAGIENNIYTFTTTTDGIFAFSFRNLNSTDFTDNEYTIQVEEGSTATEYEPFGSSPSPDYPSEIHNVGDNVNLADESILANKKVSEDNECYIFNNSTLHNFNLTPNTNFKANTAYTISYTAKQIRGNPRLIIRYTDNTIEAISTSTVISTNLTKYTKISNNTKTISVIVGDWGDYGNEPNFYIKKNSFIIREGNVDVSTYSPYNCGNANIRVSNKNLYVKDNSYSGGNNKAVIYNKIVLSNGNYTFYANNKNWISVERYNKSGVLIDRIGNTAQTVLVNFEVTDEVGYIECYFSSGISNVDISTYDFTNVMIVKGTYNISNLPTYIEGKSQIITFPFTEGQRMYLGDYLADDGMHHVGGPKIFDGSEDERWYYSDSLEAFYNIDLSDAKLGSEYLCNSFIKINNSTGFAYMHSGETKYGSSSDNRIYFKYTDYSTVEDFKTWMANNPIKVQYIFKEEIIEPYTEEQEEAYWQLQHALMYEDYTRIECIDETKAKFVVTYSYNNDINITYGKRIDDLEYKIHQLENIVNNLSQ